MLDLGTVRPGTTIYIPFHTFDSNDPSASTTITGLATTDIEVYKNGSTTQRASDSGYALLDTDGIDFDTTTGIHGVSIDLADNTTAGFWAAGAQYWVVIASVTVDAATVNFIAATFRIGYPDALINTTIATLASQTSFTLTAGPAEDDALNGCVVWIHDVASAVQCGHAVISGYTGSTKTVTLAAGTTFTAAASDNIAIFPPALLPATAGRQLAVDANNRVDVGSWLGTAVTTSSTTSKPEVDVNSISDNATAANNLELDYDGTGYAKSNSTIGTCTTNTDMRGTDSAFLAASAPTNFSSMAIDVNGRVDVSLIEGTDATDQINAAVDVALATTTYGEPGQGTPGATVSLSDKISYLYKAWRNKSEQDATTYYLYADDGSTVDQKATVSDNGTTATKGEVATGP